MKMNCDPSEDPFRMIFEKANDGIVILDMEGKVKIHNEKASPFVRDGKLLLRTTMGSNSGIEDGQNDLNSFIQRSIEEGSGEDEFEVTVKESPVQWVNLSSSVIRNDEGRPKCLILIITDITRQKDYSLILKDSQMRFQMVVESLHEGLAIMDSEENFIYANKALSDLLGYDRDRLVRMNMADIVAKEEFERVSSMLPRRIKGETEKYESGIITSAGERKKILVSATPWFNEKGEFMGTIGLLLDITDQRNSENALAESEEKYRAAVEQSAENIYIFDVQARKVVESNKALQDLLGYSAGELKGMIASDFVAHSENNIRERIDQVLTKGQSMIGERTYRKKDGTYVDVEVSASHITQGNRSMLCVVSRDITERKRYQAQLIEERNRAEFYLDLLAHDMGNLLHGIKNGLDAFGLVRGEREKEDRIFGLLRSLTERSTRLASDVLTFSRIRDTEPSIEKMELRGVVMRAYDKAKGSLNIGRSELKLDMGPSNPIWADDMIEEAFFNLFHNSLKAQGEGTPVIGVNYRRDAENVTVEVWDHGGGIPEDRKSTLFDRFEQVRMKRHTGIGMTIVQMIVSRYGGSIEIEDLKDEAGIIGSRFWMVLPTGERV